MFENIAAQMALEENSYELIFFDEFKIASRYHNFYGGIKANRDTSAFLKKISILILI